MSPEVQRIVVQNASTQRDCPDENELRLWAATALADFDAAGEVTLRLVDEAEMQELNRRFRDQDKTTNVLTFAADQDPEVDHGVLGDVVICAPVVAQEAQAQNKAGSAHWTHLVTHGVLHLLGFDHDCADDARMMEAHEKRILAGFGIADPYVYHEI